MDGQVNLFGVMVSLAGAKEALQKTNELFADSKRHIIRFVDTKACMTAKNDEDCKALIERGDLVLPANLSTEEGVKQYVKGYREVFWHKDYFEGLFTKAVDEAMEIYFYTATDKEYDQISDFLLDSFPYLAIHGKSMESLYESDTGEINSRYGMLANDINSVAPEILFLYVDINEQNSFLERCYDVVNARVMICGTGMFYYISGEQVSELSGDEVMPEKLGKRLVYMFERIKQAIKGMAFKSAVLLNKSKDTDSKNDEKSD
ncbi:MAG: WecB/TagA/CpsF family glycosyltransferase [Lachnospiraceae bacterium]|nr:WecB/TagA/CpsF family glycosyltransferase [Lachnospiraceae bacterium]